MKFTICKNGKSVIHGGKVVTIPGGIFETSDKKLQEILSKCKGCQRSTQFKPKYIYIFIAFK